MKYKTISDKETEVVFEFSGEDILVGYIHQNNCEKEYFIFSDIIFQSEKKLSNYSLSNLKDQISNYYSSRDTINKIENGFPFYSK